MVDLKQNIYRFPLKGEWPEILTRPVQKRIDLRKTVKSIFDDVEVNGDAALRVYSEKFDKVDIDNLMVSEEELRSADDLLTDELKTAVQAAKTNIYKFHFAQKETIQKIETQPGVVCWRESRGISNVGLYIPGGSAPLFSTVLMLGIPAKIAGCENISICTPPLKDGSVHPAILYAAKICGIENIYKVGGAQAIAALTFGTETVKKADKIFGPGNQFVTAAKEFAVENGVAIDLPAGPSEVLIIADASAVPEFCAADLLSQAEHGADSQVIFITTDEDVLEKTIKQVETQLRSLKRKEISDKALEFSRFILVRSIEEAINLSNFYAPEHLIFSVQNAEQYTHKIYSAGSVFLGNFSPESVGDYASGTNHTLPTNGFARNYSGVSLDSFIKKITFQDLTQEGLKNIGKTVELMAEAEGLDAHKNAVSIRLKYLENEI